MPAAKDDKSPPVTEVDPGPVAPASVTAEPEAKKPVVLATLITQALALPDLGKDGITVTSKGVALSEADAKRVREAADSCGVTLIERKED